MVPLEMDSTFAFNEKHATANLVIFLVFRPKKVKLPSDIFMTPFVISDDVTGMCVSYVYAAIAGQDVAMQLIETTRYQRGHQSAK